jgi:hypothetical protein
MILAGLVHCSRADVPQWVNNSGKSSEYPDSVYLTGFGVSVRTPSMTVQQSEGAAAENAKKNLIEKIRVKIVAVTSSKSQESAEKYSSFFSSAVQSTSSLDVDGLKYDRKVDDNVHYALVYIKRDELIMSYRLKIQRYRNDLEGKLKLAQLLEQQGKVNLALKEYISCYPVIRQLEEAQSISTSLQISHSINELLNAAATNEITVNKIRETVVKLSDRPIKSVDDLAWYIITILYEQIQTEELPVAVLPLNYEDTKMGSSFSRYFATLIEQKCSEIARWRTGTANYDAILTGSYWEQENGIKFIVTLRETVDGAIIGSTEVTVDKNLIISAGKEIKPANYRQALVDQMIFSTDENVNGGLILEGWTNKSNKGNLFVNGEKMNVIIKVNMPCYIRFVYHMADGKRVLLLNETYIDQSKVNIPYTLPNTFECSDPFGSEVLQIFARTAKFDIVQTVNRSGYNYLVEDLNEFVANTRGMKEVAPATMQAECRINITTMRD